MNTVKKTAGILMILLVILVGFPATVKAQQFSLSISPPLIETAIKPGKSILVAYTVSNVGDPAIISADIRPFKPTGIYGGLTLENGFEGPIRFNLDNSNISLGKPFFLKSREGQQLLLKIRVPEGIPEGDYYYTFYVQNELGKPQEGFSAAQSQARIGANILITVTQTGSIDVGGSIGSLSIDPHYSFSVFGQTINLFESTDTIPVDLILQNTGRNYVKPSGSITLQGNFGDRAPYSVIPQNILAQSSRLVQATPSADIERTLGFEEPHSFFISGFFVGKYTLTATINFGLGTGSKIATVHFYALPFKLLFATGIALIAGFVIIQQLKNKKEQE